MKTAYSENHGNIYQHPQDTLPKIPNLPGKNFSLKFDDHRGIFFLSPVAPFTLPPKIYGKVNDYSDRILNTYKSREISTGTLLFGEKGSGKSLLAKNISIKAAKEGIPTIIVSEPFSGTLFSEFIANVTQEAIILLDEFEKVYKEDKGAQQPLLSLLDGLFSSKKLFILTANDKWKIDPNLKNRPGRLFYSIEFNGVDVSFIDEYCKDNLKNMTKLKDVKLVKNLVRDFNFDQLQALVEELNRYSCSVQECLELLNIKYIEDKKYFKIKEVKRDGKIFKHYERDIHICPFTSDFIVLGDEKYDPEGNYIPQEQIEFESTNLINYDVEKEEYSYKNENTTCTIVVSERNKGLGSSNVLTKFFI